MNSEKQKLEDLKEGNSEWRKWGPYLSERQWGTVREDYSEGGDAWGYLPHDDARSRAYRWGEDGIAGICDEKQNLAFAPAFWNGKDSIIKERLFGVTGPEGNHGEDVKELYYYLDSTPTHSYMKMLYKYPQNEFPYKSLIEENSRRSLDDPEFELIDSGIFDKDEYFDVFVEYAKAAPEDILIKVTIINRAAKKAKLNFVPQIWFRNTWAWGYNFKKPQLQGSNQNFINIHHDQLGKYRFYFDGEPEVLFCENETNSNRLFESELKGVFKDGINDFIVHNKSGTLNSFSAGTKAGLNYSIELKKHESKEFFFRLSNKLNRKPFEDASQIFDEAQKNADNFYAEVQKDINDDDERNIQRQAFAGLLCSKQFYYFNISKWLKGDPAQIDPPVQRRSGRNSDWTHLNNDDIISMPDKWEYPWYAVWDLAFHCIPLAMIDPEFAKDQIEIFTREWYMHPNGQLPAYEWNFGDVNPPVHAWAAWRVFKIDEKHSGKADYVFLEKVFHKLLLNFTWWVNKKDAEGHNIFQGGFLGMDNIGVFDRSSELPTGGHIDQSDGTSWMAMYSLNMLKISLELCKINPVYQDMALKFYEHFLYIAEAMTNMGGDGVGLWDNEDEFYYDVLHTSTGDTISLKLRSMVGLVPLFAVEVLEPDFEEYAPEFYKRLQWFLENRPEMSNLVSRWYDPGFGERRLLSLLRGHRMKRVLKRMLDETEFLSDYGIRSLSKVYENDAFKLHFDGTEFEVRYTPAESDTGMFGGNSNWRGPLWMPVNYLIIESLQKFHHYYGNDFKVEYPTNSGNYLTINDIANELSKRLTRLFKKDSKGKRPIYSGNKKFQSDPHFKDYILFYEYFDGNNGKGLGASHQTGWTALIAKLMQPRG